jgi:hypothetical protein
MEIKRGEYYAIRNSTWAFKVTSVLKDLDQVIGIRPDGQLDWAALEGNVWYKITRGKFKSLKPQGI